MSSLREGSPVEEPPEVVDAEEVILELDEVTEETPASQKVVKGGKVMPLGKQFQKGVSGHPGGKPKSIGRRVREMVKDDPAQVVNFLFDILQDERAKDADRIHAAKEILDRGWGKAPAYQPIEHGDPLEMSELDKAIRDIADTLVARRAHPVLNAEVVKQEFENGYRTSPEPP